MIEKGKLRICSDQSSEEYLSGTPRVPSLSGTATLLRNTLLLTNGVPKIANEQHLPQSCHLELPGSFLPKPFVSFFLVGRDSELILLAMFGRAAAKRLLREDIENTPIPLSLNPQRL
jgi:hypothetical protein